MSNSYVANATTTIAAPKVVVWEALVTPHSIKQYMFGTDVSSTWEKGGTITWKGEMKGKQYEDKGVILEIDAQHTLQYTHFSPASGAADVPEHYHTVTIDLSDAGGKTQVSLSQDNNETEAARLASENNWRVMLDGLKNYVEKSA